MGKLSKDRYALNGEYIKTGMIKECHNCGCLSPAEAEHCCWCGSDEYLMLIDGFEEVKKEQKKVVEAREDNTINRRIIYWVGMAFVPIGYFIGMAYDFAFIRITV